MEASLDLLYERNIDFEISTDTIFEIDVKELSEKTFQIERKYIISFISEFAPPDSPFDLYQTQTSLKGGNWIK